MELNPISHELMCIYITADSKKHFTKKKAEKHQRKLSKLKKNITL